MQRFRDDHNTKHKPALYDEATVREVLVRAAEIEVEQESELLTASQIETLGNELGLSQEAVRRALGEKIGASHISSVTPKMQRQRALSPLTQEQIKAAYALNFWYCLLCFFATYPLRQLNEHGAISRSIFNVLMISIVFVAPTALAFRSGYLTRRVGTGAIGGAITIVLSFMILVLTVLATTSITPGQGMAIVFFVLSSALLGAFAGALGAVGRRWWESLPRNSDR